MTLSIVIPCYNEEKRLARCFKSILEQREAPDEVVFVNNNCTDHSLVIAKKWQPIFRCKNIDLRIIHAKKQGIVPARTAGFRAAQGDLIGSLDVDSSINSHWVKIAKKCFKDKEIIAISGPFYFNDRDRMIPKLTSNFISTLYWANGYFRFLFGCNMVFRQSAYQQINGLSGWYTMFNKLGVGRMTHNCYDDNYLTERFKRVGKIKFVWSLRAEGEWRVSNQRIFDMIKDFFLIKRYIGLNYR